MRCLVKATNALLCVFFASFLGAATALNAADKPKESSSGNLPADSAQSRISQNYGDLPLSFEKNRGQADPNVRFLSRGADYTFFLTPREAVLAFSTDSQSHAAVFRLHLVGSNSAAHIGGTDPLPGSSNYFLGSNPSHWRTSVSTYRKVAYENIYSGINLVYYGNQRQLEYDFVVAPGADPRMIRLAIEGADKLSVDAQGNLVLGTSEEVRLLAPKIYQEVNGQKREIAGRWNLDARHTAGFDLASYDHSRALVIDPVLMYSSFLGGSQTNSLSRIAIDSTGNAYVAGVTASGDFPASPTPQATTFGGGSAQRGVFVAKIDPTGSTLLYSTYLSGSATQQATGLALDASGNAYVTGNTTSTDFPVRNAFQPTCAMNRTTGACSNAFLTKISATGDALLYSTYLGGTGADTATSVAVDSKGSAYVVGTTTSQDFPATTGALQTKCVGSCTQNAFVAKFNPTGESLLYATYLGGSGSDRASDVALDSAGNAYITGHTTSPDFPLASPFQKICTIDASSQSAACLDTAFVTKISSDGSALAYSTYLGGSLGSEAMGIAVDALGSAYVTGTTQSADFPVLKPFQKTCGLDAATGQCSVDVFLSKFSPTGKALTYSTYLGGSGRDEASGITLDAAGNAHIVGRTESADFPTAKPLQSRLNGPSDAFVAAFNTSGSALVFSTYHGGSATESGNGIALDAKGNIYIAGETSSPDFPTQHPFQSSCAGNCTNAFVSKLSALPAGTPVLHVLKTDTGSFTQGSTGTWTISVSNTITGSTTSGTLTVTDALPSGTDILGNPYTYTLSSGTGTNWSCSSAGTTTITVTCTDSVDTISGGSSFPLLTLVVNIPNNSPTSVSNTASTSGGGAATASGSDNNVPVTQVAAKINVVSGSNQSTAVNTPFANPLVAQVLDAGGAGINGLMVSFTAPASGASETPSPDKVTTAGSGATAGTATSDALTANGTAGTYTVAASVTGLSSTAPFTLTNVSVTINPASKTLEVNNTQTFTATVTPPKTITWSLSGANCTGAACGTLSTTTGTSTTYTAPATAPLGTVTLTASATGGFTGTATITVTDFTLSVNPTTQDVIAGTNATTTLTASAFNANGYSGTLTPSCMSPPTGVTCSFNPTPFAGPGTSTLTIFTTTGATPGADTITIQAVDLAGVSHTVTFTLTVVTITITPTAATVEVNNTKSFTGVVAGLTNTTVTWSLSGTNCSGGTCGSLSATTGSPVTYTSPGTAPLGAVTLRATASDGLFQTAAITVTDFSLAVSPLLVDVAPTGIGTATPTLTASAFNANGYSGTLTPTCVNPPANVACSFNPTPFTGPGTSTLTITATGATAGVYPVTLQAVDTFGVTHTTPSATPFTIHVVTVSVTPPTSTIEVNQTEQFSATITGAPQNDSGVDWSVVGIGTNCNVVACGTIPAGGSGPNISPNTVTTTYSSPSSTKSGLTVVIEATADGDHAFSTTTASFPVTDYNVAVPSALVVITQNAAGTTGALSTLTATGINGYAGTINHTPCGVLPITASGPTCLVAPPAVPGSLPVSVTTQANTPVGLYSMNITATDNASNPQTRPTSGPASEPLAVQCTLSLQQAATAFTPAQGTTPNQYSFGVAVAVNGGVAQGGSACPYGNSSVVGGFTPSPVSDDGTVVTSPPVTGTNGVASSTQAGIVTFEVAAAGTTAATGSVNVAYFNATQTNSQTTLPLQVSVEAQTLLTAEAGTTTQVNLTASQTGTLSIQNIGASSSTVCGVVGPTGPDSSGDITCTAQVTGSAVQLSVSVSSATPALRKTTRLGVGMELFYAASFWFPAIVFLAAGASVFGLKRKRRALRRIASLLGLLLVFALLVLLPACGGGFTATPTGNFTSADYTLSVMGYVTDSNNNLVGVEIFTVPLNLLVH